MNTPYSNENAAFSNSAHNAAQNLIYPAIFNAQRYANIEQITYLSTQLSMGGVEKVLDGHLGIDRIVLLKSKGLQKPIEYTVQERFRAAQYARYQDVTITEWNTVTNQPSELYKLKSHLFVYGYYDHLQNTFLDWITLNTPKMLLAINTNEVSFKRSYNPRSSQYFLTITFAELRRIGAVICEQSQTVARRAVISKNLACEIPF